MNMKGAILRTTASIDSIVFTEAVNCKGYRNGFMKPSISQPLFTHGNYAK